MIQRADAFLQKTYGGSIEFDGRRDDRQNIEALLVDDLGIFGHGICGHGICQSLSNCRTNSDERSGRRHREFVLFSCDPGKKSVLQPVDEP